MRIIKRQKSFRQDMKRKMGGIYRILILPEGELWYVVDKLANDEPLEEKYQDHALHGDREGSRECHIKPDLLLVYKYVERELLILERLGSHSEIFGM